MAILWHFWPSFKAYEQSWASAWPTITCPNGHGRLAKNGTFCRDYVDAQGLHGLRLQRYRCRPCHETWTLFPTFATPFSAYAQGVVWAVAIWHRERGWSWRRIQAWCTDHHVPAHLRTLQRWARRWSQRMTACLQLLMVWIADHGYQDQVDVWGRLGSGTAFQGWRRLWRGLQQGVAAWRRGAVWVGPTLLGVGCHTECRMVREPTAGGGSDDDPVLTQGG